MDGWIKLHRSLLDWEWFKEPNTLSVFIFLLISARHDDCLWQGITIKAGEVITSLSRIAEGTGLSFQQTRTALNRLINTCEITSKSTNKYTIITISNYDSYQCYDNNKQQTKQHTGQQTNNKQNNKEATTNKNNINYNINNNNADNKFIEYIYKLYPSNCPKRGTSTGKSTKDKDIIRRLLKKYTKEQIEAGVKKEIDERYGKQYMRNFSTFLNNFPDPNDLFSNDSPVLNQDELLLQKMYETLTPEKEAEIYGLDPYEFSRLNENGKKMYRESYKDRMMEWIKNNQ